MEIKLILVEKKKVKHCAPTYHGEFLWHPVEQMFLPIVPSIELGRIGDIVAIFCESLLMQWRLCCNDANVGQKPLIPPHSPPRPLLSPEQSRATSWFVFRSVPSSLFASLLFYTVGRSMEKLSE